MCYKTMTAKEQADFDQWMDEMDAEYLEECRIEDMADDEAEREFNYYGEF